MGKRLPPWRSGIWTLDSEDGLPGTGNHLEDHLTWLLDQLEPKARTIHPLSVVQGLNLDFWCGYVMGQANSGFGLSIARIVALGADLNFDIYGENVQTELEHWVKP